MDGRCRRGGCRHRSAGRDAPRATRGARNFRAARAVCRYRHTARSAISDTGRHVERCVNALRRSCHVRGANARGRRPLARP
ncbi:amidohydrolase [Burkholderia pseudomallei]|uniref:Amidohydrolase n=1 Tax=Burkholderia pseudomallei TaxID=28450 RepID=A0AAX0U8M9_BURPE|nr:amidohydrolase [Burkholderia pseudomallei]AYX31697.1 amidohydrolase [Burkholderia pseudomallei]PJO64582.1 amidohydrolase [Burkholderia pseudomallei]PNW95799.1 amidohydrolase [Burkholderia pseudomallei]PNX30487.1 amidohydrolase [Burkholderia pseudomallei]